MKSEVWKDIDGYAGLYKVSNTGEVKSLRGNEKNLKQMNCKGHLKVGLYINKKRKWFLVHRLVSIAFLPNHWNLPIVNHIDGDKKNNNVINLEWCTYKHNMREAYRIGLRKPRIKSPVNNVLKLLKKLTPNQLEEVKRYSNLNELYLT